MLGKQTIPHIFHQIGGNQTDIKNVGYKSTGEFFLSMVGARAPALLTIGIFNGAFLVFKK